MKANAYFLALVPIALVSACVTQRQPILRPGFQTTLKPSKVVPSTFALFELSRAHQLFLGGNQRDADAHLASALKEMDRLQADEKEGRAVAVNEKLRTYRGEPYERATAYLYRGLCRFNVGDYEGALSAFRNAIARDEETRNKKQKLREDFTIGYFLTAIAYKMLGEDDNARQALLLARRHAPGNLHLSPAALNKNFVAVVAAGSGPRLEEGFFWGKTYAVERCPVATIKFLVDGQVVGDATEATDLYVQAKSQTWGAADSAALARGVGKTILSGVISGLTGANVNIEEHRDLRCWRSLPQKLFILMANVPLGTHTVSLECFDDRGNHLERYGQVWFEVPAGGRIFYARVAKDRQNIDGFSLQPLENSSNEKGAAG